MKNILPRLREMFADLATATGEPVTLVERVDVMSLRIPSWLPARN